MSFKSYVVAKKTISKPGPRVFPDGPLEPKVLESQGRNVDHLGGGGNYHPIAVSI